VRARRASGPPHRPGGSAAGTAAADAIPERLRDVPETARLQHGHPGLRIQLGRHLDIVTKAARHQLLPGTA
jgi:hypothetical protein